MDRVERVSGVLLSECRNPGQGESKSDSVRIICIQMQTLLIPQTSVFLNLGSVSWFEANGYGCNPIYSTNQTDEAAVWPVRPERVENCLLGYDIVELIHSGAQLFLSVWILDFNCNIAFTLLFNLFLFIGARITGWSSYSQNVLRRGRPMWVSLIKQFVLYSTLSFCSRSSE